jgi:hypothetical protein
LVPGYAYQLSPLPDVCGNTADVSITTEASKGSGWSGLFMG